MRLFPNFFENIGSTTVVKCQVLEQGGKGVLKGEGAL